MPKSYDSVAFMQNTDYEPLDVRQMEAFAAVMSAGSITGAARLLGRSQPALSRLIQDLETRLGFALLHRNGPRVSPTERGVLFHEEVERFLTSLHHMHERALAIGQGDPEPLAIEAIPALAGGLLPLVLARLAECGLPSQLSLRSSSAELVIQSVLARNADIGVTSLPVEHAGLDLHWIGESDCVAAVASSDPLAAGECLPIGCLLERRLITMANPYRLRGRVDRALQQAGIVPQAMLVTNASINAIMAAHAGLGVAIVEPATAYAMPVRDVTILPIDIRIPYFWGVFTVSGKSLTSTMSRFISTLADVSREVLPRFAQRMPGEMEDLRSAIFGPFEGEAMP
jgi:DNA-binding transcriptional LysR family regulator